MAVWNRADVGGLQMMYTYCIVDDFGHAKIGKSIDPEKRLASLQTANPRKLRIYGILGGNHEQRLHSTYQAERKSGEWFAAAPALLAEFAEIKQDPQIIERLTIYRRVSFRSELEARWALFFDIMKIEWHYQTKSVYVADEVGRHLFGFYLPFVGIRCMMPASGRGTYIEIHATNQQRDETKHTQIYSSWGKRFPLAVFVGAPDRHVFTSYGISGSSFDGGEQYLPEAASDISNGLWWDSPMGIYHCVKCDRVKIEFAEGNYLQCEICGIHRDYPDIDKLKGAADSAARYSFY